MIMTLATQPAEFSPRRRGENRPEEVKILPRIDADDRGPGRVFTAETRPNRNRAGKSGGCG